MLKIYQKYIIKNFLKKYVNISLIFFFLIIILGILEEINFLKNLEVNNFYPFFLTFLNTPITLFEIFPFIFLLTTQFLLHGLSSNDELNLLKSNGISNLGIIKILFFLSLIIGVFNVVIIYNVSSKFKLYYSIIKNNLSNDNKYLAMVTDTGLWIKDETQSVTLITKSNRIEKNFLIDVIISKFDKNFELIETIQSNKVNINKKIWIIYDPIVTKKNIIEKSYDKMILRTNFDKKKITNLFSNISTYNMLKLLRLKKDYERLGYSSDEIFIQILKLITAPLLYAGLTVLSSIISFNFVKKKSFIFQILLAILISLLIYYLIFIFNSLGINGKIPIQIAIFFPILIITFITIIGLIRVNEK